MNEMASNPQFWVVVVLFATLLADVIRRDFHRRQDKKVEIAAAAKRELDRKTERLERAEAEKRAESAREKIAEKIKAENREVEERVKRELERNAAIIKQELDLHYAREILELEKNAFTVVKELGMTKQSVDGIGGKIVTLIKADEHKNELKEAILESTEKAGAAYEVANTINEKLSQMSAAGLLTKEQEAGREHIETIESEHKEKESGG